MDSKKCKTCSQEKPLSEFYQKERKIKTGKKIYIDGSCQDCERAKKNKHNEENRERIRARNRELYSLDPERFINYALKYQEKYPEEVKIQSKTRYERKNAENPSRHKENYQRNREEILLKNKEYRLKNNEEINAKQREYQKSKTYRDMYNKWRRNKRKSDPLFKLSESARKKIKSILNGWSKTKSSEALIGCSWVELRNHLESLWLEGMSWENYGLRGWHIDHIIPLSSAKTQEEIEKLCHHTNLQPLWAQDNLAKGKKILPPP